METLLLSYEEVGKIAEQLYQNSIRAAVETPENIGKMVVIDIETRDYSVNKDPLEAANYLYEKNPLARLFGIRIGYNVAVSFGGNMERVI
ncbi:MAG: hypothetical protein F6K23_22285 [Okeania sp. SIO2C9]|uniref:hypothetical protein n=1 Tax=Okeania sp. SIO2C9 TaxID=2607791 RepID=UPI0013C0B393|nr:hypothetical protein [Okeania sp. SIO2C9]NEQ75537.1 hypothetical protein [Okeania sp. SIO2C9]